MIVDRRRARRAAYVTGDLEARAEAVHTARRSGAPADCDDLAAVVDDARDGAERVRKIVHGLRSFSRSREHEHRLTLVIADVLEAAIRLTSNEVRHRAQLVREFGPVPAVTGDDGQLTQVFINLLVNAAHAMPEGHSDDNRVTVRTRTDDQGRAVIEVADTGLGMTPEVEARVFDPFFTTKDVGEGTGLGLSICHSIVAGLGGQISIESARGHGTVIRVVLPAATADLPAASPAPVTIPPAIAATARRYRVLLVDDEPQVAHTMERLLRRDHDVTVALCGRDAIDHITKGTRFDAIISDVMMPNMTGIDLLDELQRIAPDQALDGVELGIRVVGRQVLDPVVAAVAPALGAQSLEDAGRLVPFALRVDRVAEPISGPRDAGQPERQLHVLPAQALRRRRRRLAVQRGGGKAERSRSSEVTGVGEPHGRGCRATRLGPRCSEHSTARDRGGRALARGSDRWRRRRPRRSRPRRADRRARPAR